MTEIKQRSVLVLGQGYVGLPLAVRAAEIGHSVVGYDPDVDKVKRLADGESHVEDISADVLGAALGSGRYRPSSDEADCAGFDVAIITVPTPLLDGIPDLSFIEDAATTVGRYLTPGATVVLESTTYPGTTEEVVGPLLENTSGLAAGEEFHLGFSPERIDPGNPTWGLVNTPKVVSGVNPASLATVQEFYDTIVDRTVPVAGPKEAELTKLLENTFRHVNIALVNELAMFAGDLGIDIWQVIDAAATKPFGFMPFVPGPGVGGHCLPIDPSYLSWRVRLTLGYPFRFVELAQDINNHMPEYVVSRLSLALNRQRRAVNGSRILLLGLSYKRNSSDARESPAVMVAQLLLALGAEVHAADPHVSGEHLGLSVAQVGATAEEISAADAVVILTDHDAFDYEVVAASASYVLDTRHRLSAGERVEFL